jgi:hypothetical protein
VQTVVQQHAITPAGFRFPSPVRLITR